MIQAQIIEILWLVGRASLAQNPLIVNISALLPVSLGYMRFPQNISTLTYIWGVFLFKHIWKKVHIVAFSVYKLSDFVVWNSVATLLLRFRSQVFPVLQVF